jgi:hypothetical protein
VGRREGGEGGEVEYKGKNEEKEKKMWRRKMRWI